MFLKEHYFRKPNNIEQDIISITIKNTRSMYIEMFVVFLVLDIAIWSLIFLLFSENWFLGCIFILIGIMLSFFLNSFRKTIKKCSINNSCLIYFEQGEWKIELQGSGKTQHYVSKVNNKLISLLVPDMYEPPKNGESKNIKYEYVQIFDTPPLFGHNSVFISIEGNTLGTKHLHYMKNIKPVGLFSIILVCVFSVILLLYLMSSFTITFCLYICLILLYPFIRTIRAWINNKKLKKELLKNE